MTQKSQSKNTICFSGQNVREKQTLFISYNPSIYAFLIFFLPFFFYVSLDRQHIAQRSEDEDYGGSKIPSYTTYEIALETNKILLNPSTFLSSKSSRCGLFSKVHFVITCTHHTQKFPSLCFQK